MNGKVNLPKFRLGEKIIEHKTLVYLKNKTGEDHGTWATRNCSYILEITQTFFLNMENLF